MCQNLTQLNETLFIRVTNMHRHTTRVSWFIRRVAMICGPPFDLRLLVQLQVNFYFDLTISNGLYLFQVPTCFGIFASSNVLMRGINFWNRSRLQEQDKMNMNPPKLFLVDLLIHLKRILMGGSFWGKKTNGNKLKCFIENLFWLRY